MNKEKILKILICSILVLGITGCSNKDNSLLENNDELDNNEKFYIGHTLDDERLISFTFDVPYNDGYLGEALLYDEITEEDFINKLEYVSSLNDGGSKLYRYNSSKKTFGDNDFYVLV